MSKKNKKEVRLSRKNIALTLHSKLDNVLKEYKSAIGEKEYLNHIKKAAKNLASDIIDASQKKKEKLEKEIKKKVKQKNANTGKSKSLKKKMGKSKEQELTVVSLPESESYEEDDD